jgi:hypothetical protein
LQELRDGLRQRSVISIETMDSLRTNDKQVWRTFQKRLEDIGITVAAFDANKDFIFEWFTKAKASGAFEEQTSNNSLAAELYGNSSAHEPKGNLILSPANIIINSLYPLQQLWKLPLRYGIGSKHNNAKLQFRRMQYLHLHVWALPMQVPCYQAWTQQETSY